MTAMKNIALPLLVAFLLLLTGLLFWIPSPIDAVAYQPGTPRPLTGPLAPNTDLTQGEILAQGQWQGAEDIDQDTQGRLYTGNDDGSIRRLNKDGSVEVFANTGGRPLGLDFNAAGELIVADAYKGLLAINHKGEIRPLSTTYEGQPLGIVDDVVIASDGMMYFSDATNRFTLHDFTLDALEGRGNGRLFRYDPKNGQTTLLLDGLFFANGVAMGPDDGFVLVNESWRSQVRRYWLKGPKAGQNDVFIGQLPGIPDGISHTEDGRFRLALF